VNVASSHVGRLLVECIRRMASCADHAGSSQRGEWTALALFHGAALAEHAGDRLRDRIVICGIDGHEACHDPGVVDCVFDKVVSFSAIRSHSRSLRHRKSESGIPTATDKPMN